MTDPRARFHPSELDLDLGEESVALLQTARDLEAYAEMAVAAPTIGFEDRVMAAIATEAMPRPSARHGLVALMRDAWASAFGPGRPVTVRAQAVALLLVFAVAIGSIGTLVGVGANRLFLPDGSPAPVVSTPSPSPLPSPSPSVTPSLPPSLSPTPSATPTETPSPTDTEEPTGTSDSGSGHGGGGGSRSDDPGGTPGNGSDRSGSGSDDASKTSEPEDGHGDEPESD